MVLQDANRAGCSGNHSVSYGKPPIFGEIFQQWVELVKEQVRMKRNLKELKLGVRNAPL